MAIPKDIGPKIIGPHDIGRSAVRGSAAEKAKQAPAVEAKTPPAPPAADPGAAFEPGGTASATSTARTDVTAGFTARSARNSPALKGHAALPTLDASALREVVRDAREAMKGSGMFGLFGTGGTGPGGIGTDTERLLGALGRLSPADADAFAALYRAEHGVRFEEDLGAERALSPREAAMARGLAAGDTALVDSLELERALDLGDAPAALARLEGRSAEDIAALQSTYRAHFGRDLEYDMRGFALDMRGPLDKEGLALTLRGLEGPDLARGFELLHRPRLEQTAARIATLTDDDPESTSEGRAEIYGLLGQAGGEERALLARIYTEQTGGDLVADLAPALEAAKADNDARPITTPPDKTVAVIVSSGNWKALLEGTETDPVGGYHWREIEAYVKEALEAGFAPVIFTPDGLPPSPDALSLLQGTLGSKLGFGLRPGTGPQSAQGQAIVEGFLRPRSMDAFDPDDFATMHIAGGHGSNRDIVGDARVEQAGLDLHAQGKIVTAVCHATPALGKLLEGGPATGFSPAIDKAMLAAGYVLPEFDPPYDAHDGLRDIGVDFSLIDSAQALMNIHHTETYRRAGEAPVVTGTGPEATDNVARQAFAWLARQ